MTKEKAIAQAMLDFCDEMSLSPSIEVVSDQETPYDPVIGVPFLAGQLFTNDTTTRYVGEGRKVYQGILQVTVVYPRDHGVLDAIEVAGMVIDHFKKGTIIDGDGVRVKITRQPSHASATPDGAWLRVPVSIPYICMT